MPLTVTVDPGPSGDDEITMDELPAGQIGVLVAMHENVTGYAASPGDPVIRLGNLAYFFRTDELVGGDDFGIIVRAMRPGERLVVEPVAAAGSSVGVCAMATGGLNT